MIYIHSALIVLVFFTLCFIICIQQKNYGLVDIAWGIGMSVVAGYLLVFFPSTLQIQLSLMLIIIWGLRLGIYLGKRNWGKPEDYRYVQMRQRWGKQAPLLKAFVNVFVLQGVLLYLMMVASLNAVAHFQPTNVMVMVIGIVIALLGLGFEIIGDYQLAKFKANPNNKGKLMKQGLWAITRHPNYFGEVVFWWGVYVTSFQGLHSLLGIISPLLITVLINYVSGIPLLERKYATNQEYREYAKETPRMIPYIGTKALRK